MFERNFKWLVDEHVREKTRYQYHLNEAAKALQNMLAIQEEVMNLKRDGKEV